MVLSSQLSVLSICVALLVVYLRNMKTERRRLPPGPTPIPVLGNVRGIDISYPWKTYAKWGKEYGLSMIHNAASPGLTDVSSR
jgi:hypothetical protein